MSQPTSDQDPTSAGTPVDPNRYVVPKRVEGWFAAAVRWLTAHGISLMGSRVLLVRGRTSGELRSTPVNLLELGGERYLVAPRGRTQWVRNLEAAGTGELRVGRRVEEFRAVAVTDADKVDILRDYLHHWKMEVGVFFDGVGPDSSDAELAAIAPGYPVFMIEPA